MRQARGASLSGQGTDPLVAVSLEPKPGFIEVGPLSAVKVTLSEAVDPGSLGAHPLTAVNLFTARVLPGSTSVGPDGLTLVFKPESGLPAGAMFSVDISVDLLSLRGGKYAPNFQANSPQFPAFYSTFREAPVLTGLLRVTETTSSSVALEWDAASDNSSLDGSSIRYRIYVARGNEPIDYEGTAEQETEPAILSDVVTRLEPGVEYRFAVRASDVHGNLSLPTNEVVAQTRSTSDSLPPEFSGITRLEVNLDAPTTLKAVWSAGHDLPDPQAPLTYNVYVATQSGKQSFNIPQQTSAVNATELVIEGLIPDTEYFVVVRAMDAAGNEETNTIEAPTPRRTPVSFAGNVLRMMTLPQGYDPSICWPVCTSYRQPGGCARGGCHSGGNPAGGLGLLKYQDYISSRAIVPGNPGRSDFIARLRTSGARRMPRGGTCNLLEDCIRVVERWIEQGAVDN